MAYDPLNLGATREALSASLSKIDTMLSELYVTVPEGDFSAISQNIVPSEDNVFTLGSPTNRFNHLYVGPGSITIGDAVITATVDGQVVLPGVTQASTYVVDRVVASGTAQEYVWGSAPTVIDQFTYLNYVDPVTNEAPLDWEAATYLATINDGTGFITSIAVQTRGNSYSDIEINGVNNVKTVCTDYMLAYSGSADPFAPFVAGDWTPIPFYVISGIGQTVSDPLFSGTGDITFSNETVFGLDSYMNFGAADNTLEIVAKAKPIKLQINNIDDTPRHTWVFGATGGLFYNDAPFTSGIDLTAFSVTTATASSGGSLAYDNETGEFTFAPADLSTKQDTLVSGTSIKTINGTSLLGSGDIVITGGGGGETYDQTLNTTDDVTFASVTTTTLTVDTFESTGAGTPAIESATTVTISTSSNAHQWTFNTDGSTTYPDTSIQTTAYPGTLAAFKFPYYASTGARDTAIPSPVNGMAVMVGTTIWMYGSSAWVQITGTP